MMRMLKLQLKSRIIVFAACISISLCNVLYANEIYSNSESLFNGPMILKDSYLIVTGDSFAGKFCEYEEYRDLTLITHARAGIPVVNNWDIMSEAMNFNHKNVLISIGVNDQFFETPPYMFESKLRFILNLALSKDKNVIFHSYLKYFSTIHDEKRFNSRIYDGIIRRLCSEYPNTKYIDCFDLESERYISEDNMHYNKLFYDELYKRVLYKLKEFEMN